MKWFYLTCKVQKIGVITLISNKVNGSRKADRVTQSVDPDQTASRGDLGLHYYPRHVCLKTEIHLNLFITQFGITWFWMQHRPVLDAKC